MTDFDAGAANQAETNETIRLLSEGEAERDGALRSAALQALQRLYGSNVEAFSSFIGELDARIARATSQRPAHLSALDAARQGQPHWFERPGRVAYCTYIDRFSGTLAGCIDRIPYLKDLGVGLFHPLPLLKPRDGENDGGFAVVDYGAVDPRLGTFDDLKALAQALRSEDMSLVLDVVCNHTAKEHAWAQGMLAGDPDYADFYIVLQNEAEVDAWSAGLADVFPDTAPGSFTFDAEAGGWVWTTFYPFQWDLNYANPRVFLAMLDVLFDLANAGVEGFRLDSAAFLWKVKGTICRNLPQAHDILFAYRTLLSIVAPGVFLLAEAIEGLDDVIGYFGQDPELRECDLAYNNTLMTALWGSLADGHAEVASRAVALMRRKPTHGVWLNYVRCHDDIIWQAVSPWNDAHRLQAWSDFFAGKGASFAHGLAFQAPAGLAASTCGMAASLCGEGADGLERLKLLYGLIMSLDGVPMIYMGDELALPNDNNFAADPEKASELRWLHRPRMDWNRAENRHVASPGVDSIYSWINRLRGLQATSEWWPSLGPADVSLSNDSRILKFRRPSSVGNFVLHANFCGDEVSLRDQETDLITGNDVNALAAYQMVWTFAPSRRNASKSR